jgi:hypothetical protein
MATYDRDDITPLPSDAAIPTIGTSAVGQTRTSASGRLVSGFTLKADTISPSPYVSEVPGALISTN